MFSTTPKAAYDDLSADALDVLTKDKLDTAETALKKLLNVDDDVNLLNDAFEANGTSTIDALLDTLEIEQDTETFSILQVIKKSDNLISEAILFKDASGLGRSMVSMTQNEWDDIKDKTTSVSDGIKNKVTEELPDAPKVVDTTLTAAKLNDEGITLLLKEDGPEDILSANAFFAEANKKAGSKTSNDADAARFFHAATRLIAFGMDINSDNNPDDTLATMGDILDGMGCNTVPRINFDLLSCPDELPSSSPNGSSLNAFVVNSIIANLESAISDLDKVSASFETTVKTKDNTTYEVDYGDALLLRAFYHTLAFKFSTLTAHNWSSDLDTIVNSKQSLETVRTENSTLASLGSNAGSLLSKAKTHYLAALSDTDAAITSIRAETAPTEGKELIDLSDTPDDDIAKARTLISQLRSAATAASSIDEGDDTFQLDLSPLFEAQVSLASLFDDKGELTDNTWGGINPDGK